MPGEFVALADLLRAPAASAVHVRAAEEQAAPPLAASDASPHDVDDDLVAGDVRNAVREARLFRARLADAFDDAAARLLRELASDVLARELRLEPCDLAAIVQRVAQRAPVVRVRVAPCDLARRAAFARDVAIVADTTLAGGDAIVELVGGALDARLGVRLATVLEVFS